MSESREQYRIRKFCENYTLEELAKVCVNLEDALEEFKKLVNDVAARDEEKDKQIEKMKCEIKGLETELRVKEELFAIRDAISEESCDGARPSIKWYEDRYQSDCIRINQLHTTIDVLTDKLSRLRGQMGL